MSDVFETESTPVGEQLLVAGVRPITLAEQLAWRARMPLGPRRPQKSLNIGLFDDDARAQLDLF